MLFHQKDKKSRKDGVRFTCERIMAVQAVTLRSTAFQATLRDL